MQPLQPPSQSQPTLRFSAVTSAVGGGLALLGFFLPWVMIAPNSISGWFLVQHAGDPLYGLSVTSSAATYLTLAGALATLIIGIVALAGRRLSTLTYIQALGSLIGVSDLVLTLVNVNGNQFNFVLLGYGFWIAFFGFALSIVGAVAVNCKTR